MAFVLKVDSSALVVFTNKLEQMRKYDFPLAVRGTLNSAAFDTKQKTMPASADKHFVKRKPNFFKANSKVQMAQGFDVNVMKSEVGFISTNLNYNHFAVYELEQQEYGGVITNRSFIPLEGARRDKTRNTMVNPKDRLSSIEEVVGNLDKIISVKNAKGKSKAQQFIKSAIFAGKGGFVKAGIGKEILYRINSVKRGEGGKMIINKTPIYSYDQGRGVDIEATGFMREASLLSATKLEAFYIIEANKRFAKLAAK